jgi:hypothetical protein
LPLLPFRGKEIKSKAGETYVATRRAKISQNLANAPLDYNAIFIYAELQRSLWRLLHGDHRPETIARRLLQQSQSLTGHFDQRVKRYGFTR